MDRFAIAAFRSRQSVFAFESILRRNGLQPRIISTPHQVSVGCGLSVSFSAGDLPKAYAAYQGSPVANLVGFFNVTREGARTTVTPVGGF
ncbi:MAG: DUF3343 domain-containing protein [Christensenellaceae bacterium]|jgi:hypothetical protein|nr:DUF3343 domain-containing protein [Christensenellaceae bacterium]